MDTAIAYAISALIAAFGIGIFIAGLNSGAPALWTCVALDPIAIGLLSACGDKKFIPLARAAAAAVPDVRPDLDRNKP